MSDKMQIRHIAIRSEDPDQLGAFYERTFGLRVVMRNARGNKSSIYMTDGFMRRIQPADDRWITMQPLADFLDARPTPLPLDKPIDLARFYRM